MESKSQLVRSSVMGLQRSDGLAMQSQTVYMYLMTLEALSVALEELDKNHRKAMLQLILPYLHNQVCLATKNDDVVTLYVEEKARRRQRHCYDVYVTSCHKPKLQDYLHFVAQKISYYLLAATAKGTEIRITATTVTLTSEEFELSVNV